MLRPPLDQCLKHIKQVFKENFQIYGLNIYGDPSGSLQNFQTKLWSLKTERGVRSLSVNGAWAEARTSKIQDTKTGSNLFLSP